jgi:hypothetical protein
MIQNISLFLREILLFATPRSKCKHIICCSFSKSKHIISLCSIPPALSTMFPLAREAILLYIFMLLLLIFYFVDITQNLDKPLRSSLTWECYLSAIHGNLPVWSLKACAILVCNFNTFYNTSALLEFYPEGLSLKLFMKLQLIYLVWLVILFCILNKIAQPLQHISSVTCTPSQWRSQD